jgi:hypothetical protein
LLPFAVDASGQIFFSDFLTGIKLFRGAGARLLTVVEPDGSAVAVAVDGTQLYWITRGGAIYSQSPSSSSGAALYTACGGANEASPFTTHMAVRGGVVYATAQGPVLVTGVNCTVAYAQYVQNFESGQIQVQGQLCRAVAGHADGTLNQGGRVRACARII